MGLFKKIVSVVTLPVTAPLKVASNIADNTGIGGPVSSLSSLASAPFELLQKGTSFGDVVAQAKPGLQVLGSVAGGPIGGALGLDTGAFAKFLPDLSGPPAPMVEDRNYSGGIGTVAAPASKPPNLTPYIIGGAAFTLVLIVALRRR